jgi:hypothetical protein
MFLGDQRLLGEIRLLGTISQEIVGYQEKIHRRLWLLGDHSLPVENSWDIMANRYVA